MSAKTTAEWLEILSGIVPVGPVHDVAQALDNPFVEPSRHGRHVPHPAAPDHADAVQPAQDRRRAARADRSAPPLGADNEALLGALASPSRAERAGMKLEGLKVVDLSVFLPGPYLTLALADHGAEVIKVEPPGEGDPGRDIGPADGATSVVLQERQSRQTQRRHRPQVGGWSQSAAQALRYGGRVRRELPARRDEAPGHRLRHRRERAIPGIVYCSISAFGQDGPYRDRPAHDLAVMALSGALSITLGRDGAPAMPGVAMADMLRRCTASRRC